jgi:chromosome segregation ATPase
MLSEAQLSLKDSNAQIGETEAQNSKLRQQLSSAEKDLEERTQQLLLFQRSIGVLPETPSSSDDWNALKSETLKNVNLAKRLEQANMAVHILQESKASLERRLQSTPAWKEEGEPTRSQWRSIDEPSRTRSREGSPFRGLPSRFIERTGSVSSFNSLASRSESDSIGSDDLSQRKHTQNLRNEIEELTAKLELSEMQRRRLESRGSTHSRQSSIDGDTLELRRLQRENVRLHSLVDEQAEKLSSSETSRPRTSQSSRPSTHLADNIKELEQSKQKLMEQQNVSLRELTKCRAELDKALQSTQKSDYQIKSLRQELEAEKSARKAEQQSQQQYLSELKNLKIRMETTSGKYAELEDTLKLQKSRFEDLQNKLEDAEIGAHNAMRSESYAREQLQEVEDTLISERAERRRAEDSMTILQKELRSLEGRVFPFVCCIENSLRIMLLNSRIPRTVVNGSNMIYRIYILIKTTKSKNDPCHLKKLDLNISVN